MFHCYPFKLGFYRFLFVDLYLARFDIPCYPALNIPGSNEAYYELIERPVSVMEVMQMLSENR